MVSLFLKSGGDEERIVKLMDLDLTRLEKAFKVKPPKEYKNYITSGDYKNHNGARLKEEMVNPLVKSIKEMNTEKEKRD